jgi:WD40 repeat protein/serine/threonine protein kinase
MSASSRCPNGHVWSSQIGAIADGCPICGATADDNATTIEAPRAVLPPDTPTAAWDGTVPVPGAAAVPVPGYELLGELGRGGMGVVFRARQVKLNRIVALKMVLSGELASPGELARFRAEAEAAAHLQHPNIVQLYEFGEIRSGDGQPLPYFALEFVNGGSLADRLDGKPQPAHLAAGLIETLARAMHYAHTKGVVHRDLKPGNVLLHVVEGKSPATNTDSTISSVKAETPKVTDFGLAKRLDSSTGQTQSGAVLGTPQYMAPEQAAGRAKRVGPPTDTYALGAILYELATGRPPFAGETPLETILQVSRDEPVPPRLLNPNLPRDLETITLKCLQKDPARRYATAQELADDLARFQDDQPITARPVGRIERTRAWTRRHPTVTALIAVTVVAAASLLAMGYRNHVKLQDAYDQVQGERDVARQERAAAHRRLVELTVANGARRADDGDLLLALPWYAEALRLDDDQSGSSAIHRMRLAAALDACPKLAAAWNHTGRVTDVAFRPDGKAAVTADEYGAVHVWDPDHPDEPAQVFEHLATVTQITYRPDGGRLLVVGGRDVHIWDPAAGPLRAVKLSHPEAVRRAAWSPDGRRVLTACADGIARLWDAETGRQTGMQFRHDGAVTAVAISRDGRRAATGDADGFASVWDLTTGRAILPRIIVGAAVTIVALSPDGSNLLAAAGPDAHLWNATTGEPAGLRATYRQDITDAAFSLDGRLIATVSLDGTGSIWNLDTEDWADESMHHGSGVLGVAFSPDGQWAVTCSDDNTARVWDTHFGSPRTPPLPHTGTVARAVFSPDGRRVLTAGGDGLAKLWELRDAPPPAWAAPLAVSGTQSAISRDGSVRITAAGSDARILDARSGAALSKPLRHGGPITCVAVSPDGKRAATAGTDRVVRLWDWRAGKPAGQSLRHGSRVNDVVFSPDGRRVGTGSDDNTARVWDAATGESVSPPLSLSGSVHAVRFSPDGNLLLSVTKGPYARVWDAAGGEAVAVVPRDAKWVAEVLSDGNRQESWDLPSDPRPADELTALAQWLSGHRVGRAGGLVPLDGDELKTIGEGMRQRGRTSGNSTPR